MGERGWVDEMLERFMWRGFDGVDGGVVVWGKGCGGLARSGGRYRAWNDLGSGWVSYFRQRRLFINTLSAHITIYNGQLTVPYVLLPPLYTS
jgi:hypothetical protein